MKSQHNFRSGFEKTVYEHAVKVSNRKVEYEPKDPKFCYTYQALYLPDFRLPNGIYIETKGYFSPKDRRKMLAVKKQHPEADIRFVFQRANNKLTKAKNSKSYWAWAEQHGFQWAEGTIPLKWWREKRK